MNQCLKELGLNAGELLDPRPPSEPPDTVEDDIHALGGLLQTARTMHKPHRLSLALGWDLARLRTAITALDALLRPCGLRIHENSMGVTIRPTGRNIDQAIRRLSDLHDDEEGIHQGTARVLFAIYQGTISTRETRNDHMVQLGALKNRGAIAFGSGPGDRYALSADVTYAFAVEDGE